MLGAAILGSSAIGGAMDMIGANQQNIWNARSASAMMEFQREMASTQHQREVEDLKKAGLNPILSAGGSGAAAPSGAMAQGQNTLSGAAGKLVDVVPKILEAKKTGAETKAVEAAGVKSASDAAVNNKSMELMEIQKKKLGLEMEGMANALKRTGLMGRAWEYLGNSAKGVGQSPGEDLGNAIKGVTAGLESSAKGVAEKTGGLAREFEKAISESKKYAQPTMFGKIGP